MALRKPIFISEQGYSQELDGYADSVHLSAMQIIDQNGVAKVSMDADGYLSVAAKATLASAEISNLTETRIVFAGADGYLVDDAALTFISNDLTIGATDKNGSLNLKNSNGTSTIQIGTYAGASTQLNLHDDSQNLAINNYVDANSTSIGLYKGVTKHVELYTDDNGGIIQVNGASGPNTIVLSGPDGSIMAEGAVDFNSTLDVAGQVDLAASGVATSVRGVLNVAEDADLNGALDVAGQVDLAASGVATSVRGTLNVAEETTLASAIVSDLTDTYVVFAGASGALVDSEAFVFKYGHTLAIGATGAAGEIELKDDLSNNVLIAQATSDFGGKLSFRDAGDVNPDGSVENKILLDASLQKMAMFNMNTWGNGNAIGMISYDMDTDASVRARGYAQFLFTEGAFPGGENQYIRINDESNQGEITGLVLPTVPSSAANKEYVDGYVSDLLLQINAASDSSFSDFTAAESLALGNPVFINSSSQAAKADADFEAKSWVIGVAKAAASAEGAVEIIRDGVCAGALTGLSFAAADQIWLAPGGGLVNAKPTASGARLILVGFAKSADDLFVDIRDYGRNV